MELSPTNSYSVKKGRDDRAMVVASVFTILLVLIGAWQASSYAENQIRIGRGKTLSAVNSLTHQAILTWVRENQGTARIWARDKDVVDLTEALLTLPRDRDEMITSPLQQQMRQILDSVIEARQYAGYYIIAPDNVNVSSMRNRNIGVTNLLTHQSKILARAWAGETVISLPQISDVPLTDNDGVLREYLPTQFVVSPIRDRNNVLIALIAFRIDPRRDFAAILEQSIWGKTGESYVFDKQGLLLSESRHTQSLRDLHILKPGQASILNVTLTPPGQTVSRTRLVQAALASEKRARGVILDSYIDYRGELAMGAWNWDPEFEMGIATEIDETEALDDLGSIRMTIWTMAALLIATIVIMLNLHRSSNRKLVDERRRFKDLADHAFDMISRSDAYGVYRYVSPACTRLLGYQPDELVGHYAYEYIHPDDAPVIPEPQRQIQTVPNNVLSYRLRHKDGHYVWVEASVSVQYNADGSVKEFIVVRRDISARKKAENALIESESRYRALVENLNEGVLVFDHTGTVVAANPQALLTLGLTEEQMLGRSATDPRCHAIKEDGSPFLPDENPTTVSLRTGKPQSNVIMGLYRLDGTVAWISANCSVVESDKPLRDVVTSFRDITQQRQADQERDELRDQLQQSQKMQALGQLTGGIAHDFNNILAGIQGYSELLAMSHDDGTPESTRNYLAQIMTATERASLLVQQLLIFSRNKPGHPVPTEVGAIVREVVTMLAPAFTASVQFNITLDSDLPRLMIDPTQLHQVITNLCINARDAMNGKGNISISAKSLSIRDGQCASCRHSIKGEWIALDIGDTGRGINADTMGRMFEPFFTTKMIGKGSGMGLAIVHGIIHEHGGHIQVISTIGQGTLFRLLLPAFNGRKQIRHERIETAENG